MALTLYELVFGLRSIDSLVRLDLYLHAMKRNNGAFLYVAAGESTLIPLRMNAISLVRLQCQTKDCLCAVLRQRLRQREGLHRQALNGCLPDVNRD